MRTVEENRKLCEKYPFLKYDDSYKSTWADDMPMGWWIAFGEMMCDEIKAELVKWNFLDEYQVIEIKEKWGYLHWYDNGIPSGCKVWDIIEKYATLSESICIQCGKPDVPVMTWGWIIPLCQEHAINQDEYAECADRQSPHKMNDFRRWSKFKDDKWVDCEVYIGDTAQKIRDAWQVRQQHEAQTNN